MIKNRSYRRFYQDEKIDRKTLEELVDLARPLSVPFHRAFDVTPDAYQALAAVIETGASRLLTAGQQLQGAVRLQHKL